MKHTLVLTYTFNVLTMHATYISIYIYKGTTYQKRIQVTIHRIHTLCKINLITIYVLTK